MRITKIDIYIDTSNRKRFKQLRSIVNLCFRSVGYYKSIPIYLERNMYVNEKENSFVSVSYNFEENCTDSITMWYSDALHGMNSRKFLPTYIPSNMNSDRDIKNMLQDS